MAEYIFRKAVKNTAIPIFKKNCFLFRDFQKSFVSEVFSVC